ncbi:MAG TPA: SRPBCC domain-containing protein [Flavobacteriales bacterium]|nr:SRPBCC domain-containing protein [Flavobacteriales bacterium]
MTHPAIFNFTVQKEARQITVDRSFNAPLDPVWSAWTEADILCKWWAPKPYQCVIKALDFREGGRWHYYMQGPEGDRHWCYFDYEPIRPKTSFSGSDSFCDENGVANSIKPKVTWEANFSEVDGSTTVHMVLHFASPEDLEEIIAMGFKEGFTMGLDQLEELLTYGN